MHDHTQIKILDLDDVKSIILQEITVAEAEKIIGGNVDQRKVEPATNKWKISSVGDCCSCQGENKECWLKNFIPIGPDGTLMLSGINQSYLDKSSITSKLINKVNLK